VGVCVGTICQSFQCLELCILSNVDMYIVYRASLSIHYYYYYYYYYHHYHHHHLNAKMTELETNNKIKRRTFIGIPTTLTL
jgi:hypothetical protein